MRRVLTFLLGVTPTFVREPGPNLYHVKSPTSRPTVNTKLSLRFEVLLAPEAEIHRRVFITVTENYSVAAARESTPNSIVTRHQTGWSGSASTSLALLGEHSYSRSTPGTYRAHLKVEESSKGLPGKTLVDEVIIHLTLEP